jgi:hypothetical protein
MKFASPVRRGDLLDINLFYRNDKSGLENGKERK